MKTKTALLVMIATLLFGVGCEKKTPADNKIIGSWKCIGFGNAETNNFKDIEPKNCDKCYTITFNTDGTLIGHTSTNNMNGGYVAETSAKTIKITRFGGTKINELLDGNEYVKAINQINSYLITSEGNLQFFYENQSKYLLFELIKK